MGFASVIGIVNIRFACAKGFAEAEGHVESDTEVSFLTPNFEKFGPMQVRPLDGGACSPFHVERQPPKGV